MGHRLSNFQSKGILQKCLCTLLVIFLSFQSTLASAFILGEFGIKDEKALGEKFNVLIRAQMALVQDPEITRYIESIVSRLEEVAPPHPFPFTPSVILHNAINAFAVPGGYIFIHTGLITAMNHESELAGVIAHEMAHVLQRHIAGRIEKASLINIASVLGAIAGIFVGGDAGGAIMAGSVAGAQSSMLKYSRDDEHEADQVGMNMLAKAGFNPHGMAGAFKILSQKQWIMGTSIPSYLSTHPQLSERASNMELRVRQMPKNLQNIPDNDERFLRIQTLVRSRYADPDVSRNFFNAQIKTPQKALGYLGLGILSARQNKINDAKQAFANALALNPNDQLFLREAGYFHYTKGDRAEGAILLERAVALDSSDIMALFYQASYLAESGNLKPAIENAKKVLRFVPEDPDVHDFIARLYGQDNQLFKANLHMAYGALYSNNKSRIKQFVTKTKALIKIQDEQEEFQRFEKKLKEREEFWK